jgi:hypothetical protein
MVPSLFSFLCCIFKSKGVRFIKNGDSITAGPGSNRLDFAEKFCPVCKNKNPREAPTCRTCGAALESFLLDSVIITRNTATETPAQEIDGLLLSEAFLPAEGIAIYVSDTVRPALISLDREVIIGRNVQPTSEAFLDLTNLGGYLLGLSRRHARIRRYASGYEIIDLGSTNGTWLNDERLVAHQPYPLTSGSRLRLARMRLFVLYRSPVEAGEHV